jgi:cytoskeletal protein CcmA (bactofilin family)
MARRDQILAVSGNETIIGTDITVTGNLKGDGDITVDGILTGDIDSPGNVTIGVNATVKGDVKAGTATVAGQMTGNITAEGEVQIMATGRVQGDIVASTLSIQSGALFMGSTRMTNVEAKEVSRQQK